MAIQLKLPELGENIEEADVLSVLVSKGDLISIDDPVIEIETEKATVEVPSFVEGRVSSVSVNAGDTIKVGQVILSVDEVEDGESVEGAKQSRQKSEIALSSEPENPTKAKTAVSPDLREIAEPGRALKSVAAPPVPLHDGGAAPVFASPSTRGFAREIGVDIRQIEGSGPGGRISEEDVKAHSRGRVMAGPPSDSLRPLPDFSSFGPVERIPMSRVRRAIAANTSESASTIPHVTLFESADVTDVEELRLRYKPKDEAVGGKLTITAIILKIVASALKAFPSVNASLDTAKQEIVLKHYFNIGVAADTERGLVVPVVKDVDKKNIIDLSVELVQLAEKARSGKLSIAELQGGNIAVTNLGGLGTGHFTPIINSPDVAILGVGRAEKQPVYGDSGLEPRLIAPLSLAFDHRALDGADGARFLHWIVEALNEPLVLALEG